MSKALIYKGSLQGAESSIVNLSDAHGGVCEPGLLPLGIALSQRDWLTGSARPKATSGYRFVGRSVPRIDLPAKLAGAAFIHDVLPEGVLHARMLRQPSRGATLAKLDEAAIRKAAREIGRAHV
mgnify:CR=1 FL=1